MSERIRIKSGKDLRILCVGDLHFPYASAKGLAALYTFAANFAPTHVVQIGDLYDQYNFSKYPKEQDLTPVKEIKEARKQAEAFWKVLKKDRDVACFQARGNHDERMMKKVRQQAPELVPMVKQYWDQLYQFPQVYTLSDERSELVIDDILFIHGYLSNLGDHLKLNRQSTVVGHSHRGGAVYQRYKNHTLFELNCGHLADDRKLPFSYTPQRTTFWTPGWGTVEKLPSGQISARFIPL